MATKVRSSLWAYFSQCDDSDAKVIYKVCKNRISSSGVNLILFNTTNLRKHLEKRHIKKYRK